MAGTRTTAACHPFRKGNMEHDKWYCRRAPTVNAAKARALAPFLVELAAELYGGGADATQRLAQRA